MVYNNNAKEQDGACARDIWKLYHMSPLNSYFTLYMHDENNDVRELGFNKYMENERIPGERDMKTLLGSYQLSEYRSVQVIWNKGFGNSIQVHVFL